MSVYSVKEIFLTLQGEGYHAGRRAVFVRFAGCNLWTGREQDRTKAICQFCDTDFVSTDGPSGGKYSAEQLADTALAIWNMPDAKPFMVVTGGEPLLQLDAPLIAAFKQRGFEIAVESNGTIAAPAGLDWLCISPKAGSQVIQQSGNELKLVWPQNGIEPSSLLGWDFEHYLLQPLDDANQKTAIQTVIAYVEQHPQWRMTLQTHKIVGLK